MGLRAGWAVGLVASFLLTPGVSASEPSRFEVVGTVGRIGIGSVVLRDVSYASGAAVDPSADGRVEVMTPPTMAHAYSYASNVTPFSPEEGRLRPGEVVYVAGFAASAATSEPSLVADRAMHGDLSSRPEWLIARAVVGPDRDGSNSATIRGGELDADISFSGSCWPGGSRYEVSGTWTASEPDGEPIFAGSYVGRDHRVAVTPGQFSFLPRVTTGIEAIRRLDIESATGTFAKRAGTGFLLLDTAGNCADAGIGTAHFFLTAP